MKKNKYTVVLAVSILAISIVVGCIYGINNPYDVSEYVKNISPSFYLFDHALVITLFFVSTLSILGVIIAGFYIGFSGVSIGFIISSFFKTYGLKGILFSLINIVINKVFFTIVIIYLFCVGVSYAKKCLSNIVGVSTDYFVMLIKPLIKKYILIFIFVIIYDILNYFLIYKISIYFASLLKLVW